MAVSAIIQNYAGKKLGGFLTDIVSDLNPIQLSKANISGGAQVDNSIGKNAAAIKELVKQRGQSHQMGIKDYFAGKKMGVVEDTNNRLSFGGFDGPLNEEALQGARASTRTLTAGAIAAYGLSPFVLGDDNVVNRSIEGGAGLAVHGGVTAALARTGKQGAYFGAAYAGYAAFNAFRQGNNFGPF